MKKKGLIISTLVMVVVLIAALTTTTFAWFTSTSNATIDAITMEVGSTADVQIGVGTGTTPNGYRSGTVAYSAGATKEAGSWTGTTTGLGTKISPNIALNVQAAVGTAESTAKMDDSLNFEHEYYTGKGTATASLTNITKATINGDGGEDDSATASDVILLQMGIIVTGDEVYGTYGKITITIPQGQPTLGMAAALYARIRVGENYATEVFSGDLFDKVGNGLHYYQIMESSTEKETTYVFYFEIKEKQEAAIKADKNAVTPFCIEMFINGYDQDSVTDATGTTCTIDLEFAGMPSTGMSGVDGSTSWTKLAKA